MKNTLGDLNNHLFAQLERLGEEDLTEEELSREINRSKAITDVASQIISNGSLVLKSKMAYDETFNADKEKPKMLEA